MAMVMPGTLRSASARVVTAWLFMVAASITFTAWGVSCTLAEGKFDMAGAWFRLFLSALSLTETGPSCTGWAAAGAASITVARTAREAPESAMDLR